MADVAACDRRPLGRVEELRQGAREPALVAQAEREERRRVALDDLPPSPEVGERLADVARVRRRRRGRELGGRVEHRLHTGLVPARNPLGIAQVLGHEHRPRPVVVEADELGHERVALQRRVDLVLAPDPRRKALLVRRLREHAPAVGERHRETVGGGIAAAAGLVAHGTRPHDALDALVELVHALRRMVASASSRSISTNPHRS
jgi:hypothetical protein